MVVPEAILKAFHFFVYETTRYLSPFVIATEWVFVAIAILLTCVTPLRLAGIVNDVHDAFTWLAERKSLALLTAGFLPVGVRLMMIRVAGYPKPSIHDEFSHLLLADTLASGRLTNPTHPMWRHFESVHIIQRPTYNSMYPPGQGIFLALGQSLFHHPWFGVVISVGLMSMAVCWMLQGYLPAAWALYGSLVMDLKIAIVGFWMNSYMGGAVGAIGGALVVGSLPRLSQTVSRLPVILLALGLFLLMNSRPLEGGLLSLFVLVVLAIRLRPKWKANWRSTLVPAVPGLCIFLAGVVFTCYYCYRVTGSPVRMPYEVNRATYGWPENLALLPPKRLHLDHPMLQAMYEKELRNRLHYSTPALTLDSLDSRFFDCWVFFVGPALTIPMLLIPWAVRSKDELVLLGLIGLEVFVNLFQLLLYPQHLAHITGVIFALLTLGFWYLYRIVSRVSPVRARYMAVLLPVCLVLVGVMKFLAEPLRVPVSYWERAYEIHRDARFAIQQSLSSQPGKQLVIVHYAPQHSPDQEWVYNQADIDRSPVVWARDMGPEANRELIDYFHDRHVWLLNVDQLPIVPVPYSASTEKEAILSSRLTPLLN